MDYNRIIKLNNSVVLEKIFDDGLENFLDLIALHNSSCLEFLLSPLITAVSYSLQQSQINAVRTMEESMSIFTVLVAQPSTGKSPAMNLVRKSILEIERHNGVRHEDSKLVNGN